MSKFSRDKGSREERAVVKYWRTQGMADDECLRVPLSGASQGFKGDVILRGYTGECKLRANGFKNIYKWLGDNDFLTIRSDNNERLYVLKESTLANFFDKKGWLR